MTIKLFSTGCPKCKALEIKLKQLGLPFEILEDKEEVIKLGTEKGILSAPILQIDEDYYDFASAIKRLKEMGE